MVSSRGGVPPKTPKKSRRFRRLLKLITGRRQTEWTGATRCPNEDNQSYNRESLTGRKRAIFFRLCLPCRPLAERARFMPANAGRALVHWPNLRLENTVRGHEPCALGQWPTWQTKSE